MRDNNSVSRLPLFRSPYTSHNVSRAQTPTRSSNHGDKMEALQCEDTSRRPSIHENPELHRHTEATNLELFYDLFFAANLTVFSNIHEVTDSATLKQYVCRKPFNASVLGLKCTDILSRWDSFVSYG